MSLHFQHLTTVLGGTQEVLIGRLADDSDTLWHFRSGGRILEKDLIVGGLCRGRIHKTACSHEDALKPHDLSDTTGLLASVNVRRRGVVKCSRLWSLLFKQATLVPSMHRMMTPSICLRNECTKTYLNQNNITVSITFKGSFKG